MGYLSSCVCVLVCVRIVCMRVFVCACVPGQPFELTSFLLRDPGQCKPVQERMCTVCISGCNVRILGLDQD